MKRREKDLPFLDGLCTGTPLAFASVLPKRISLLPRTWQNIAAVYLAFVSKFAIEPSSGDVSSTEETSLQDTGKSRFDAPKKALINVKITKGIPMPSTVPVNI